MFAVGPADAQQPNLVGLSPDGGGVYLLIYEADQQGLTARWEQIGGPAGAIYAGEAGIFASNPDSGDLYAYDGTPMSWTRIGGPGKTFAVAGQLYGLSPDSSGVWQYSGTPMQWSQIGGPAQRIATGPDQVCAVEPGTHHLLYAVAGGAPVGVTPIQLPIIQ